MKCGEAELAADVYGQLRQEGFALERPVFQTVLEVFLKLGRWDDALGVIADMHAQVRARRVLPSLQPAGGSPARASGNRRRPIWPLSIMANNGMQCNIAVAIQHLCYVPLCATRSQDDHAGSRYQQCSHETARLAHDEVAWSPTQILI